MTLSLEPTPLNMAGWYPQHNALSWFSSTCRRLALAFPLPPANMLYSDIKRRGKSQQMGLFIPSARRDKHQRVFERCCGTGASREHQGDHPVSGMLLSPSMSTLSEMM
jgi:hypothetical protein